MDKQARGHDRNVNIPDRVPGTGTEKEHVNQQTSPVGGVSRPRLHIEKESKMAYIYWAKVEPVIDNTVRDLCIRPYPNHKKGCPNHGKRNSCPPKARYLFDIINEKQPVLAVFNIFDLGAHVAKMKAKHPNWSDRQLVNCLYWQGTARKRLREKVQSITANTKGMVAIYCPEACGVNITATLKSVDIILEWPPKKNAYQVALVGTSIHKVGQVDS